MIDLSHIVVQPRPERPVQYFKDEDIERGKKMTPDQIVQFLEDFACMVATARMIRDERSGSDAGGFSEAPNEAVEKPRL